MKIQILTDDNGNQIARVKNGNASFSIQTNQNLPVTHKNGKANFKFGQTKAEIALHLSQFGTARQIAIFNS